MGSRSGLDDDDDAGSSGGGESSSRHSHGDAPKEGSLEYYKAARDEPVWKLGDQQCAATTQQAAFLLMHLKREGHIRNGPFERYAFTAKHITSSSTAS